MWNINAGGNTDHYYGAGFGSCGRSSPESNFGSIDYAWYITSDGIANNSMFTITGSCGRSSPDLAVYDYDAYHANYDGDVSTAAVCI